MNPYTNPYYQYNTPNYRPFIKYCLANETIEFAEQQGFSGDLFDYAVKTKDSNAPEDVIIHRGLETVLKNEYGFKSPTYKPNCKILHTYDNPKKWK